MEIVTDDIAYVELAVTVPSLDLYDAVFTGLSKRDNADRVNTELGTKLAYARAFGSLAHFLQKQAKGLMKHEDDVRADQARRKAAAKAEASKPLAKRLTDKKTAAK